MQTHAELLKNQRTGKNPRRSPIRWLYQSPTPDKWGTVSKESWKIHSTIVIANLFHCLTIPTVRNFFLIFNSNPYSLSQFPAAFRGNDKQLFNIIVMISFLKF